MYHKSDNRVIVVQNTDHPHRLAMEHWLYSVVSSQRPHALPQHHLLENSRQTGGHLTDLLEVRDSDNISMFYNVALGMFLSLQTVRDRSALADYVVTTDPQDLWAVFCSPLVWAWESIQWFKIWESILRDCAKIFGGHPLEARAMNIPMIPNRTGEFTANWNLPHRWCIKMYQANINGYNTTLSQLRVWNLTTDKCLVTNSIWENVTITNCTFTRCTFRNTKFCNIHFLDCTFTDMDFSDVTIQDSLFTHTTLSGTSIMNSVFSSASWAHNSFTGTHMDNVVSDRCNWTYIHYHGMAVRNYVEEGKTEHWDKMVNAD